MPGIGWGYLSPAEFDRASPKTRLECMHGRPAGIVMAELRAAVARANELQAAIAFGIRAEETHYFELGLSQGLSIDDAWRFADEVIESKQKRAYLQWYERAMASGVGVDLSYGIGRGWIPAEPHTVAACRLAVASQDYAARYPIPFRVPDLADGGPCAPRGDVDPWSASG